jgi:ureidoacrylate peracid hydrolase
MARPVFGRWLSRFRVALRGRSPAPDAPGGRRPATAASLDAVADLVAPECAALLVIDVQNDRCHEAGAYGRAGVALAAIQRAVSALVPVVEAARRARVPVIFVETRHDPWTDAPGWPAGSETGCLAGTWGAEPYLVRRRESEPVVVKRRHSGFYATELEVILRALGRTTVVLTGVATNVCVESTARDAVARDYRVVLLEDCAGAATRAEHEAACWNVAHHLGHVLDSGRLLALWAARRD